MADGLRISLLFVFLGVSVYAQNEQEEIRVSIVPNPLRIEFRGGIFCLDENTRIGYDERLSDAGFLVDRFEEKVKAVTRFPVPSFPMEEGDDLDNAIVLSLDETQTNLGEEGYRLAVTEACVRIVAQEPAGLFYGIQSLYQLLPVEVESPVPREMDWTIPCVQIVDTPRFSWRGMHLDVSRHFFPISFIKKYIDLLSRYKLNTFHWHLTDDQGWRIEIKKYPRLTAVGAWREETLAGHYNHKPHQFDGQRYGGFYTQEEIRAIVRYAEERFVTVVPEIEMPAHSLAALASYPELSCRGDSLEVGTRWGGFLDVFCAGNERVFEFLEDVLTEVVDLFPSSYIHIGGDECQKVRWQTCKKCQTRMEEEGLEDEEELQSYFVKRIEKLLLSKDRRLIGWDEILEGGLAPEATVMSWRGMSGGIQAANEGHDVIMCPTDHCYFDFYQGKSGEPLAFDDYLPLAKVYELEPIPAEIDEEKRHHVLGAQANLWTEYIGTPRQAEYMLFPRMCALSEVVWSDPDRRDYEDFTARMADHYRRLALLDVNFRCPAQ